MNPNPRQAAEDLVNQFIGNFNTKKACALICLDYLLEATEGQMDEEWYEYYNNVKNETILL